MFSTEVWFRNPDSYIRELVECGEYKVAWDRGLLHKKRIEAEKHAQLYFGQVFPWRVLLVGDQGTAELGPNNGIRNPVAVYPTWTYGENASLLEEIVANPVGEDIKCCSDTSVPPDERPVFGQEHRVVIIEPPDMKTGPGRKFLRFLKELQEDYPDCIIHLHGLYSYRMAFGTGLRSADVEPRAAAQKGKVHLPSGKEEKFEAVVNHPHWVTALGFKPVDLQVPRNRCMYNIKSAVWAGANYNKLPNFQTRISGKVRPDTKTPQKDYVAPETKSAIIGRTKPKDGDQFQCNTCTLQDKCKYFREGSVCTVPGAEPAELAKYFKTRDSDMIIDGLGTLLQAQTRRLERGMRDEEDYGELTPEVTKIMNSIFSQGVQLAKLVDPNLRGGARVQVNVGAGGQASVATVTPQQMIGAAVRELEARGISRDKITPKMIEGLLAGMAQPDIAQRAIEGELVQDERSA